MNSDDKAKRLVELLQTLSESADRTDKDNPELAPKLSSQEIKILSRVGRERCCVMSSLAACLRLSLSTATGLIDRLVEKKLVKRERSLEDRRVVQVELTDEGRQLHAAAQAGRLDFARDMLQSLSAQEQETLVALLGKMSEKAKAG